MPIDTSDKEQLDVPLTGTQMNDAIVAAHKSKDAIENIEGMSATGSEIDETSYTKYRGVRNSTQESFLGKSISILGDSLTFGANATDYKGYAQIIRNTINTINNIDNFGLTGVDRGFDATGQTIIKNEDATDSLCGAYFLLNQSDTLDFYNSTSQEIAIANKSIKVLALIEDNAKTIAISEYDSSNNLLASHNLTVAVDGLTELFTTSPTAHKLTITNNNISTLKIEGYHIVEDYTYHTVNIMAKGGRELELIENQVIDRWFDNSEYAIMALGTNDNDLVAFADRIDYIISKYNTQTYTKLIILYMDSADTTVRDELIRLNKNCKGSQFVDFRSILTANNTLADRDDLVSLGLVDSDRLHFTDLGHEYLASIMLSAMGYDSIINSNKYYQTLFTETQKYDNNIYIDEINRNVKLGDLDNLESITTGTDNSSFGDRTLEKLTSGGNNTAMGSAVLRKNTSGGNNTGVGAQSLRSSLTGGQNTAIGTFALISNVDGTTFETYDNCTGLGYYTRVSGSNQVQLGNSDATTYAYGAVQDRSDIRDKADIEDTPLGLDFISKINPVQYRWDYRDDYDVINEDGSITKLEKDGSKKRSRLHQGVIAQQVKEVIDELGVDFGGYQDHSLSGGCDVKSIGYQEFIPPLIKAIQELKAEVELLKGTTWE